MKSFQDSTCCPFQGATKLKFSQTHRHRNCRISVMPVLMELFLSTRKNEDREAVQGFVASKTRVVPLKKMLPSCLELMKASVGAFIRNNLLKQLNLGKGKLKMWTDSMNALYWIFSTAQTWKPFVANRVTEI